MTPQEIHAINRERFAEWMRLFNKHSVTPMAIIGISHTTGLPHIAIPEDMDPETLAFVLQKLSDSIERRSEDFKTARQGDTLEI